MHEDCEILSMHVYSDNHLRSQHLQTLLHLSCLIDLVCAVADIAVKVAVGLWEDVDVGMCIGSHSPNSIVNTKL